LLEEARKLFLSHFGALIPPNGWTSGEWVWIPGVESHDPLGDYGYIGFKWTELAVSSATASPPSVPTPD
jgi:hypothetical protein